MGNAPGGYEPIYAAKKDGTTLVEVRLQRLQDAPSVAGERPSNFTPVVLTPTTSMAKCCGCCPLCYVSIPSGFSAIVTKFGAVVKGDVEEDDTWSPGCHCFWPLYSVDKLVSTQLITFDTPVKDCKTANFITVNLDVMLQFEITNAKEFVFCIGAEKFDDYLRATQDEVLRTMCNETQLADVFDLCGRDMANIVKDLNVKFSQYGVKVHNFTVKDVKIPPEMANDAEEKTLFDAKTEKNRTQQQADRQRVQFDEAKSKMKEECENLRSQAEQVAKVEENKAMKETAEVVSRTSRDIQELEGKRDIEARKMLAAAELEVSKQKAQILSLEREMKSKMQAECARIRAEATSYAAQQMTDSNIEVAQKLARGKEALGEAEGSASDALAVKRAYDEEQMRLNILQQVLMKSGMKIATSQENTVSFNSDNETVTQVAQQGLEALRAKLAEITATSLTKLQSQPLQQGMR